MFKELQALERSRQSRQSVVERSPEELVSAAMRQLDDIRRVASDPTARMKIAPALAKLGLQVGLNFCEGTKGKTRKIRRLASGIVMLNDRLSGGAAESGEQFHKAEVSDNQEKGRMRPR